MGVLVGAGRVGRVVGASAVGGIASVASVSVLYLVAAGQVGGTRRPCRFASFLGTPLQMVPAVAARVLGGRAGGPGSGMARVCVRVAGLRRTLGRGFVKPTVFGRAAEGEVGRVGSGAVAFGSGGR